jgi:hypothetical protein
LNLKRFTHAFVARKLHPRLEEMVWHYAYGRPAQAVDLSVAFDHESYLAELTRRRRLKP